MNQSAYPNDRQIRVFVSSTFRDMQAERNELVRHTFPKLRRWCESRGVVFTEIDLRWGVTTSERDLGLVLPICLEEVERCRPFFIGLLGNHYGSIESDFSAPVVERFPWLVENVGRSLTELEMIHGAFAPGLDMTQTFFYLRDDTAHPDPGEAEAPESHEKLRALKQRAIASGRARAQRYRSAEELGGWILDDLQAALDPILEREQCLDPMVRERAAQNHFADLRSRLYVGVRKEIDLLSAHYLADKPPLMIVGETGCGKSSLVATWRRLALGQQVPTLRMLPQKLAHFVRRALGRENISRHIAVPEVKALFQVSVGATTMAATAQNVAMVLLRDLRELLKLPLPVNQMSPSLGMLPIFLTAAAEQGRICLIVDGLDHFASGEAARFLAALPAPMPANIRLILTTRPGDIVTAARQKRWQVWELDSWPEEVRRHFVQTYLARFRKSLEPPNEERIVSAPQAGTPLYLRTLLEELRVAAIYSGFAERLELYLNAKDSVSLFLIIFARWESDLEHRRPGLVGDALRLLWVARRGLAESELRELLGQGERLPDLVWSPLAVALSAQLDALEGFFRLAMGNLRNAVEQRYLPDTPAKLRSHGMLADHFRNLPMSRRGVEEVSWHLIATRRWDDLAGHFGDPEFLRLAWETGREELLQAAMSLEQFSSHRLVEIFSRMPRAEGGAHQAALILLARGELDAAQTFLLSAEAEAAAAGDAVRLSEIGGSLAFIERRTGRIPQALKRLEALENEARGRGDWGSVSLHLGHRTDALRTQGRLAEARTLAEEEYAICHRLGDQGGLAASLGRLAAIDFDQQRFDAALERFTEQSALYQRLGDQAGLAASIGNRAVALARLGRPREALAMHQVEEKIARQLNDRWALQVCLGNMAGHHHALGDYDEAMRELDEKEKICQELGSPEALAKTWLQISQLHKALGHQENAKAYAADAERLAAEHDLVVLLAAVTNWQRQLA